MANEELIKRVRKRAESLQNGGRDEPHVMSDLLSDLSMLIIDMYANGCARQCKPFSPSAAFAVVGSVAAVCATVLRIVT